MQLLLFYLAFYLLTWVGALVPQLVYEFGLQVNAQCRQLW